MWVSLIFCPVGQDRTPLPLAEAVRIPQAPKPTSRHFASAVSASRGALCFTPYLSGTLSSKYPPSSISLPLSSGQRYRTSKRCSLFILYLYKRIVRALAPTCIKTSTCPAVTPLTQYNWALIFADGMYFLQYSLSLWHFL